MSPVTIFAIELGIVVQVRIGQVAGLGRIILFADFLKTTVTFEALLCFDGF